MARQLTDKQIQARIRFLQTIKNRNPQQSQNRVIAGLKKGISVEQGIENQLLNQGGRLLRSRFGGRRRNPLINQPRHRFSPVVEDEILDPSRIANAFLNPRSVESQDVLGTIEAGIRGRTPIEDIFGSEEFIPRRGILDL